MRSCPICGKTVEENKIYCSQICYNKVLGSAKQTALRLNGYKKSDKCGGKETNPHAKTWEIADPEGNHYVFTNISLWAREHESILPSTSDRFVTGIKFLKYSRLGKIKANLCQYKGWTLVNFFDVNLAADFEHVVYDKLALDLKKTSKKKRLIKEINSAKIVLLDSQDFLKIKIDKSENKIYQLCKFDKEKVEDLTEIIEKSYNSYLAVDGIDNLGLFINRVLRGTVNNEYFKYIKLWDTITLN